MNSRDFELIALGHVLTRYKLTGTLPNIDGQPFDLSAFKEKLFQGVNTDSDININIDTLKTESNVTIVENECHDDHQASEPAPVAAEVSEVKDDKNDTSTQEQKPEETPASPSGRLFQYFNRDKS